MWRASESSCHSKRSHPGVRTLVRLEALLTVRRERIECCVRVLWRRDQRAGRGPYGGLLMRPKEQAAAVFGWLLKMSGSALGSTKTWRTYFGAILPLDLSPGADVVGE